jgi:diguanylate cyclase (GGDEF)-like protein
MHSYLNRGHDDCVSGDFHERFALPGIGTWECDLRTERLSWSPFVFDIFGLPRNEPVERRETVKMYLEPFRSVLERLRSAAIADNGTFSMEAAILRPGGEERWIRLKAATKIEKGRAVRLFGLKEDVTEERRHSEIRRRSARCDALTGLASRAEFHAQFLDLAPQASGLAEMSGLALFALGNLRAINRRWGVAAGDACLGIFARRLAAAYPNGALPARLSGNEFAALLKGDRILGLHGLHHPLAGLADAVPWQDSIISIEVCASFVSVMNTQLFDAEALYAKAALGLAAAKGQREAPFRVVNATYADGDPYLLDRRAGTNKFRLSAREAQVLLFIGRGYTTDQIAQELRVSRHTVRNFIRRIYLKMDVGDRVDAVRVAAQHGML